MEVSKEKLDRLRRIYFAMIILVAFNILAVVYIGKVQGNWGAVPIHTAINLIFIWILSRYKKKIETDMEG